MPRASRHGISLIFYPYGDPARVHERNARDPTPTCGNDPRGEPAMKPIKSRKLLLGQINILPFYNKSGPCLIGSAIGIIEPGISLLDLETPIEADLMITTTLLNSIEMKI